MLVTLPFVLLLLDFWPLRRLEFSSLNPDHPPSPLLREKAPFFALAAIFSVLTLFVQYAWEPPRLMPGLPWTDRVANALVSYVRYLGKMFWPTDLAAIYPHPASRYYLRDQWPGWQICAAGLLLLAVSRSASARLAAGLTSPSAGFGISG